MTYLRTDEANIKEVAILLWFDLFNKWNGEFGIKEKWERTDWRTLNETKNIATDFAWKGRPQWWPFCLVKSYKDFTDHETYLWFEEKFPYLKPKNDSAITKWYDLQNLDQKQIEYLESRKIQYDKIKDYVKNYQWAIWCLVYSDWIPTWVNARKLSTDHKNRFVAMTWYTTNWIYKWQIDINKNYLYIVEWLIDFLTILQYDTNVVWLKSSDSWIQDCIDLIQKYWFQPKIIFDNDEAWKKTREKFWSMDYTFYDRWDSIDKDVNDLTKRWNVMEIINKWMTKQTPILSTIEKFKERQKLIKETGSLWLKWPYEFFSHSMWIVRKKVYTIWAFSNTWKSKLAYNIAAKLLNLWQKIMYVSIEESEEDMFWNILAARENRSLSNMQNIQFNSHDYHNLIVFDNLMDIKSIKEAAAYHKPDMLFIDYAQWLTAPWSAYEANSTIAKWMQRIAIENNCTVFSLSQLSNSTMKDNVTWTSGKIVLLKWAWEYYFASDVIYILARDESDSTLTLKVEKNKLWKRWYIYKVDTDMDKNQFSFSLDNSQSMYF